MRPDADAIKEHVDGRNKSNNNQLDKFSPHYDKIVKALNEVDKLKNWATKDEAPILIIGEEIDRFEGLLKKVQNHREIVNTFEDKIDQCGSDESGSSVRDLLIKEQPDQPTFVYIKGKRQTLIDGAPAISEHRTDHGSFLCKAKNEGGNRRSQSELQNVIQTDGNGVKHSNPYKNALSLDLVQILGKDQKNSHSIQRKNRLESFSDPNGGLEQGKSPANLLSNKMRQDDTTNGYEEDEIIPSQLNTTQIKNLKQFEMTKEKYEASELVMEAFQRQFTTKDTIVDKLSAFKRGLSRGVTTKRDRRQTIDAMPKKDYEQKPGVSRQATLGLPP